MNDLKCSMILCMYVFEFAVFSIISVRLEFSESLMSSLHALQKALGEPNAFSQQAAVCYSLLLCPPCQFT